jgi:hypothetical protein
MGVLARVWIPPPCAPDAFISDTRAGFLQTFREDSVTGVAKFMLERELTGLRSSYEEAVPIIADLDSFAWGGTCRPLPVTVQSIQPRRK